MLIIFRFCNTLCQARVKSLGFASWRHGFSLLSLDTKPTLRAKRASFGRGKLNAQFAWTWFKISVIFVKRWRRIFYIWSAMHSALYYHLEHGNASRCILAITYLLASNASIFCSAPPLGCGSGHRLGRIFYGLLHLSERSRTIEVRITTLSAQNTRKISRPKLLGSVYLIGSFQTF